VLGLAIIFEDVLDSKSTLKVGCEKSTGEMLVFNGFSVGDFTSWESMSFIEIGIPSSVFKFLSVVIGNASTWVGSSGLTSPNSGSTKSLKLKSSEFED
jgi:hypothetical protein